METPYRCTIYCYSQNILGYPSQLSMQLTFGTIHALRNWTVYHKKLLYIHYYLLQRDNSLLKSGCAIFCFAYIMAFWETWLVKTFVSCWRRLNKYGNCYGKEYLHNLDWYCKKGLEATLVFAIIQETIDFSIVIMMSERFGYTLQ